MLGKSGPGALRNVEEKGTKKGQKEMNQSSKGRPKRAGKERCGRRCVEVTVGR